MLSRLTRYLCSVAIPLLNIGCGEAPPPEVKEVRRPVKSLLVGEQKSTGVRNFPARIDANRRAELAFRVPGTIQELLVKEGDQVIEGQAVAKLDPKDFQIVVNDRQATFDSAAKNFKRAKDLINDGFISQADYDKLEAEFKNSRSALETARQEGATQSGAAAETGRRIRTNAACVMEGGRGNVDTGGARGKRRRGDARDARITGSCYVPATGRTPEGPTPVAVYSSVI